MSWPWTKPKIVEVPIPTIQPPFWDRTKNVEQTVHGGWSAAPLAPFEFAQYIVGSNQVLILTYCCLHAIQTIAASGYASITVLNDQTPPGLAGRIISLWFTAAGRDHSWTNFSSGLIVPENYTVLIHQDTGVEVDYLWQGWIGTPALPVKRWTT